MKIYVLTLNWNGKDILQTMVSGVSKNLKKCNVDYSILIRDNGSIDGSADDVSSMENTNVFLVGHNRGSFSQGVNYLFEKSEAADDDIILLLNNDVEFNDDDSISNMLDDMIKHNASIVGARLMYANKKTISHNGVIFCRKHGNMPWHYREGQTTTNQDQKTRKFQAVTAACSLVKASAFRKAGGLDETLMWAFEDVSLNLDVSINQGGLVACCGRTNITHATSLSLNKNPVNKMFMKHNVNRFKKMWYGKYKLDHEKYLRDPNYNVLD